MPTKKKKMTTLLEDEALEQVTRGMMYASLAITDNQSGTLSKVGKANPWHIEALKLVTGSEAEAHKPLRDILYDDMEEMILDQEIDISGITKGGQFLDTQGYIAHNDEKVVLAFRCTTSAFDWLTNFNTTSSAWEIEEDLAQGFSGFCSGFDDMCCTNGDWKPRVHTGFYNNFLAALPDIQRVIDPLLLPQEGQEAPRPRTLYVVGHSLGAGIATLAGCYFLSEPQYNWNTMPHKLVIVTAGSPRATCESMKDFIDKKRKEYGSNALMYRLVKGSDVVTSVPPEMFGFRHLIDPIFITDTGDIVLKTKIDDPDTVLLALTKFRNNANKSNGKNGDQRSRGLLMDLQEENHDDDDDEDLDAKAKYDRFVARIPKAFRDHMPDFYLKPLFRAQGWKKGTLRSDAVDKYVSDDDSTVPEVDDERPQDQTADAVVEDRATTTKKKTKKRRGIPPRFVPKMFRKKKTTAPVEELHW